MAKKKMAGPHGYGMYEEYKPEKRKSSKEHPVKKELKKAGVKKGAHKLYTSILGDRKHSKEDLKEAGKHMMKHMR